MKTKQQQKKTKYEIELEQSLPKKETFEKLHNHKPVTRRDFLSTGLIGFSSSMVLPSFLTILARSGDAQAQDMCKVAGVSDLCPFISIKGSGGMSVSGNAIPLDAGGQLLQSYSKLGLGLGATLPVDYEFANRVAFYANSGVLAGIRAGASSLTLASSNFIPSWYISQDDNSQNKLDVTGLVINAGLKGSKLPNLGKANTETGVNNSFAYVRPPAPLIVGSYDDVVGSLGVSGSLATLSPTQKGNLFKSIQSVTSSQSSAIQGMTGGSLLSKLLNCANIDNTNLIANTASLNIDPLSNAAFAAIWGINANTNKASQDFVFATMVYNALNGNCSTVNLEIGGCDYHNNTRASGDAKDLEIGTVIGRVLQSLSLMGKKGFVGFTTDGAVRSVESDSPSVWSSDGGIGSGGYMFSYDPVGPHAIKGLSQLGNYTSGQGANNLFLTGGSTELAAGALFVNYLSFNGKLNLVEQLLPRIFSTADIDLITKFT